MGESTQEEQLIPLTAKPCFPDPAIHPVESLIVEAEASRAPSPSGCG